MKVYKGFIDTVSLVRENTTTINRAKLQTSRDSADYARKFYDSITIFESFNIITLNNANNTTGFINIGKGGITGVMVDVRLVAKYALDCLATGVILVHNHPSGTLKPSNADKEITKKLKDGLKLLDINVLDHIILTEDSYFSFADENLI